MPVTVPATIKSAPLPSNFKGTLQQLQDALVSRLYLETSLDSVSLVAGGSTAPTSNVGPWFKDGTTLYVWSDTDGAYVPVSLDYPSLKYVASPSTAQPDPDVYTLWIVLDGTGKAQELRYFSGGAWKSVYDDSFLALIDQVDTIEQQFPFRGDATADQSLVADPGDSTAITFTETFDPGNVFGASAFVAPVDGYYQINLRVQMEASGGTPTSNTVIAYILKNSGIMANEFVTTKVVDGNTGLFTLQLSSIIQLSANDSIKGFVEVSGVGAGNWVIKKDGTSISGHRVFTYIP